jgi:hypothetical protein
VFVLKPDSTSMPPLIAAATRLDRRPSPQARSLMMPEPS